MHVFLSSLTRPFGIHSVEGRDIKHVQRDESSYVCSGFLQTVTVIVVIIPLVRGIGRKYCIYTPISSALKLYGLQ